MLSAEFCTIPLPSITLCNTIKFFIKSCPVIGVVIPSCGQLFFGAEVGMTEIQRHLFKMQSMQYKDFQSKLIPTIKRENIIGVPIPQIRNLAKQLVKESPQEVSIFLKTLPHSYFEENNLHVFIINQIKDFDFCCRKVEDFLPYVDNWATCDSLRPPIFRENHQRLFPHIQKWLDSPHTYTIRFGIECLMTNFLDSDFRGEYLNHVGSIASQEYYVRMMQAWYFATALAKQYPSTLAYLQRNTLAPWTFNKSIQKALESRRIPQEDKIILRQMKKRI